jgi:hypothetical protein
MATLESEDKMSNKIFLCSTCGGSGFDNMNGGKPCHITECILSRKEAKAMDINEIKKSAIVSGLNNAIGARVSRINQGCKGWVEDPVSLRNYIDQTRILLNEIEQLADERMRT